MDVNKGQRGSYNSWELARILVTAVIVCVDRRRMAGDSGKLEGGPLLFQQRQNQKLSFVPIKKNISTGDHSK